MSGRSYLSIGDVLALLRQEFPDVTISKIRFLESQGLVNPERTPSGYRKFYDTDVERLRWVLRQQREHFLPLKVIKGRLEQEVAEPVLVGHTTGAGSPRAAGHELPGFEPRAGDTPRRGGDGAGRPVARPAPTPELTRDRRDSGRAGSPATGPGAPAGGSPRGGSPGSGFSSRASAASTLSRDPGPVTARGAARSGGDPRVDRATDLGAGPKGPPGPVTRPTAPAPRSTPARGAGPPRNGPGATEPGEAAVRTLSGASMTAEELAQGSGLDVVSVQELESYGLVCGRVVGGVAYYDEDALVVARLAAGLARYGVEARHLRLHKHAAEREAGFIEQIVLPLLKQRNPEARQRAEVAVTELSVLGQGLREVLLRATLRDQLGG